MASNAEISLQISANESDGRYPFQQIEAKWRQRWQDADVHRADPTGDLASKYYVLDMFPYPSGSGLHVGHCKNYVPGDVVGRLKAMQGYNVLHPMGWDAFGQPAEQEAIKQKINPRRVIPPLIAQYKRQLNLLGIGYDWSREITSCDPEYYKWNQWAFLLLLEKELAYRKTAPVNWCVNESAVLANEEVVDGRCWRCDGPVIKKELPQWFFRITAYGDKLIDGLERIDWPEGVKTQQREWIGRSEGAEVHFKVEGSDADLTVFTTRPDTLWGATFMVLAPEHPLVAEITTDEQRAAVEAYRANAQKETDIERQAEGRPKTGVATGGYAINPVNQARIPIWIADYVLMGYGTGAIMAVPAHDQRDFEFARTFDLPIVLVYKTEPSQTEDSMTEAFATGGVYRDDLGAPFAGEPNSKATVAKVVEWLETEKIGARRINFRLRDWLVSRQRYWGTPIPIIHCPVCGIVPVPVEDLPVLLPDVENYAPRADGKSPLAAIPDFVNVACPNCGAAAERETDTMAGSVDSSWYFLRFTDPTDENAAWNKTKADYWMPVDTYIGGREHAVGHLLYARFFTKVFHDAGLIETDEPAQTLKNQGMLLALSDVEKESGHPIKPDELARFLPEQIERQWLKMSKSKGNAVTPDEMAEKYGADSLRLYILFVAPFEDTIQWSEESMNGVHRFLGRVWETITGIVPLYNLDWHSKIDTVTSDDERALRRRSHQATAKVTHDIAEMRFNTAVSEMMKFSDTLRRFVATNGSESPAVHEAASFLVRLLAPMAPHSGDELWERLGYTNSFLYRTLLPVADSQIAAEEEVTLVVQINGKVRDRLTVPADADEATCEGFARGSEKIALLLEGKPIRKIVVVRGKLVNIVV